MTRVRRAWGRVRLAPRHCARWLNAHVPPRVWWTLFVAVLLLGTGTVGFRLIEGPHWSYFDGFYMTAITLTTIGFGETHELKTAGRVFTVVLAFGGIFTLAYLATELVRGVVTGELRRTVGRRLVDERLGKLTGHTVVCGYGRMGRIVCSELQRQRKPFVVVDRSPAVAVEFSFPHGLPLHGDATADDILRKAGIERAKALITVVGSDADNLYITLSSRLLNPGLLIVARAEEEEADQKLRKVGANKVISPYLAGGHRAVQAALRPTVLHFMEMTTRPEFLDLQIEEVRVGRGSKLAGVTLRASKVRFELGVVVVGLLRPGGELVYNPNGDTELEPDAVLIALGQRRHLDTLEAMAKAADAAGGPT